MYKLFFSITLVCAAIVCANAQQGTGQGSGAGIGSGQGDGLGSGRGNGIGDIPEIKKKKVKFRSVQLLSKPRAKYTDIARQNQVQGKISLRIEFKKDGKIGKISVVQGLPDGLNEEAVKAAEQIKFEPAVRNGKPYTTTKIVDFSFSIY